MNLTFDRVTKFYGPVIGVNDLTCRVGPGITGLLGANGAGKSTLIKLASGQLRPSDGRVTIDTHDAWSPAAKRSLGYCPDINAFYEEMTGREFVETMAGLYGYSRREVRERTDLALEEVGMTELGSRRLGGGSHGMRQRIKVAQALVHDPQVLLLDEPLSGIDPGGRRDIHELLVRLAERGKTILLSSHILDEIEHVADRILMIARGRLVAAGRLDEVRNMLEDHPLAVAITCPQVRRLAALLVERDEVQHVEIRARDANDDSLVVRTRQPARFFPALADLVIEHHFQISRLETLDAGADAVFDYLEAGAR